MPIPTQVNEIVVGETSWTKEINGMVSTAVAEILRTENTGEYIKVSLQLWNEIMTEAGWTRDNTDSAPE